MIYNNNNNNNNNNKFIKKLCYVIYAISPLKSLLMHERRFTLLLPVTSYNKNETEIYSLASG